jgi:uncharacterized protein
MSLITGTIRSLKVAREVPPNGYFLTDGTNEVLLHYSEISGKIEAGEQVDVFLFHDTADRLAATMKRPLVTLGEIALLEVVDIHHRFGVFLEMGLGRNLLLPYKQLPEMEQLRPQIGDKVYVGLAHDRQGRLLAKLAGEEELSELCVRAPSTWQNQWVDARVYKPLQMGSFVVCDAGVLGFGVIGMIPAPERTDMLRLGQTVNVRVTYVREEDGRVNLSMRLLKERGRDDDAQRILEALRDRPNGALPYSDQTSADIIAQRFGMSKGAFKRALGKLMKDGLIEQKENWTHLRPTGDAEQV